MIPGQGVGPEQVPSLPWVLVSLFVEGTGYITSRGPLALSPLSKPAVRGIPQHNCGTGELLSLSLGRLICNPGGHLLNAQLQK